MMRCSRNLVKVSNTLVDNVNVYDMLNTKYLVVSKAGIELLQEKYRKKAEEAKA
jgi:ribosomal protein L4